MSDAWVRFHPNERHITWAKTFRAERHADFDAAGYPHDEADRRWIGDLAPFCLRGWLRRHGVTEPWLRYTNPTGPDFVINGRPVSTRTRSVGAIREDYSIGVLPRHRDGRDRDIVFGFFEKESNDLILIGGMPVGDFLARAEQYVRGELVHPGLVIREESYEVPIADIPSMRSWLCSIAPDLTVCS